MAIKPRLKQVKTSMTVTNTNQVYSLCLLKKINEWNIYVYIYMKKYMVERLQRWRHLSRKSKSDFGIGNGPKPLIPWQVNDPIKASYPAW